MDKNLSECSVEEIWDHLTAQERKKLFHFYVENYPKTAQEVIEREWALGTINPDKERGERFL